MNQTEFSEHVWLTIVDKGLLGLIILGAGYYINKALEGFKGQLSREQEASRTANAAVLDLTKKLAKGSHIISWLAWNATQPILVLGEKEFDNYDQEMIDVLSDLVGLQATVAALDTSSFKILSDFAEEIYQRDSEVAKANNLYFSKDPGNKELAIETLKHIYEEAVDFDKRLLSTVTGLLTRAPGRTQA